MHEPRRQDDPRGEDLDHHGRVPVRVESRDCGREKGQPDPYHTCYQDGEDGYHLQFQGFGLIIAAVGCGRLASRDGGGIAGGGGRRLGVGEGGGEEDEEE